MNLYRLSIAIKKLLPSKECDHKFRIGNLRMTGEEDYARRVCWPCMKCGKEFYAQCGLDIAHAGNIVRDSGSVQS